MATNGTFSQQDQYKTEQYPATSVPADSSTGNSSSNDLSKDEVGWYFVEQYYTTLSKSPEKLHLFYGKRSQFVSGLEAEVANVSVGRGAIQERIKELDFQDCKVRVSNVDSQASFDNIVIQVIGETSNKSAEPKKFVQTFVLAQQPTGYFVLNDIFRYINEEGEEEQAEGAQEEPTSAAPLVEDVEMPKAQTSTEEPAAGLDTEVVSQKLEDVAKAEPEATDTPETNGAASENEESPETAPQEEEPPVPEVVEKEIEEEIKEPEKPVDPSPSPAPITTAAPQPVAPAKPLSWASRAAAAVGSAPKPAVPVVTPKTSTPPAPAQARAAPPAQVSKPTTTAPVAANVAEKDKENTAPGSGWQTAGADHAKRQNRPQSISAPAEKEGTMAYIRNVTEKVVADELKQRLSTYGPLVYFDVNRSKNCAFVEFATPEGYHAANAANPHVLSGEQVYVEIRRPKAGAYGGNNYANNRGGGINGRGRGGFEQSRPGSQGGRGNFGANRGRGNASAGGARGGRGTSQATNA